MKHLVRALTLGSTIAAILLATATSAGARPAVVALDGVQGLMGGHSLAFFDTSTPADIEIVPVTGLGVNENIEAIDIRPSTGEAYALVLDDTGATDSVHLRKIDLGTGAVTSIGGAFLTGQTENVTWDLDFNPVADAARVTSYDGGNFRVNPANGALISTDTAINGNVGNISGSAYDRSFAGATATTLYGWNYTADRIVHIGGIDGTPSPNGGVATAVGQTGQLANSYRSGFDIWPSQTAQGEAFLSMSNSGGTKLYSVNLATAGATGLLGALPAQAHGLALIPGSTVEFATPTTTVSEAAGSVTLTITRTGVTNAASFVRWSTGAGTATSNADFTATRGVVSFAAGETSKTIDVPVLQDAALDGSEAFTVHLRSAYGRSGLGAVTEHVVAIADDEVAPPVVTPPTPDTTKPVVFATFPASLRVKAASGTSGILGTFLCSEACKADATLKYGKVTVGTAMLPLGAAPKVSALRVKLTKRGAAVVKQALAKRGVKRVTTILTVRYSDAAANTTSVARKVVITD